ncbi:DUF4214 domain-containing protein, partial [Sulfitobacter sp. F26204]|uniref:DUF4214 domain-containing protein n=1 Tax=Sulfitobacter sp. F26204 TaxID=2996014 RepID=UPI00225DD51D
MPIDLTTLSAREAITAVYIGYYDRAPDPTGLNFWVDVFNNGFDLNNDGDSLDDIASNFAGQEETLSVHTFFTNPTEASASAFVTELYSNLFNRVPDDAGLAFWTGALQNAIAGNGDLTVGEIILEIIKGAQGSDITIIMNKIEVGLDWNDSADAAGITYAGNDAAAASANSILDNVDSTDASVVAAKAATDAFVAANEPGEPSIPGTTLILSSEAVRDNLTGGEGNDTFEAYNTDAVMELSDGDRMDGGAGQDTLTLHNSAEFVPAIAAITKSVETVVVTNQTNDRDSDADNNVGGYNNSFGDESVEVDVELDAGRMSGVTRWEDYDSRADLVIEDARDQDDTDGTFTGDITVAMVSTDPGNVDFAVYFDQPVNVSQNFGTLEIRVLDQESVAQNNLPAPSASSTGYLTESSLVSFKFNFGGQDIEVTLADELGVTYGPNVSFSDLLVQVQNSTAAALVAAGVTDLNFSASLGAPVQIGVGNQFTLPIVLTFDVTADEITANSNNIVVLGRDQNGNNDTDTAGSLSTARTTTEELIRLNVELDDVGKGSMGGDAMFGAMSTGRQTGDDGTSDSMGIQQFDIEVDRSSQLQTINSTNNALEVVNITNGENDGPNNTTTAADEKIGSLTVRGQANPEGEISTDGPMPGAAPQHNSFGFSDVRVINAATMVGSVDLTAELTSEIIEKYFDVEDTQQDGNADDISFEYTLGSNNDSFLVAIDTDAMGIAGTGGREDFKMSVNGNAGNDDITTIVGNAVKTIDGQGRDYYDLNVDSLVWYDNHVVNGSATFSVSGGAGDDNIWTYGAGNFAIADGAGSDAIYTDNSGVLDIDEAAGFVGLTPSGVNSLASAFQGNENNQIDHFVGALWSFNDTGATNGAFGDNQGANNEAIVAATTDASKIAGSQYVTELTVSFFGAAGSANAGTAYTSTVQITDAMIAANGTVTDQTINQAIKRAINDDPVLNDLLEAVDAAGQSLFVYSKTDGGYTAADLAINLTEKVTTAGTTTETDLSADANFAKAYVTAGAETDFATLGASGVESDNRITMSLDATDDTVVLGTSAMSNDTIIYGNGQFGTDTVLNFDIGDGAAGFAAGDDGDAFDFAAISYVQAAANFSQGAANQLDNSVSILVEANTAATVGSLTNNNTAAEVADLFNGAADADLTVTTTDHIVIVFDDNANGSATQPVVAADDYLFDSENNTGTVYLVTDTDGADA